MHFELSGQILWEILYAHFIQLCMSRQIRTQRKEATISLS